MKKLVAFVLLGTMSMNLWAADPSNENWTLYKVESGVEIYFRDLACDDPANGLFEVYKIFKVVNTTASQVDLEYSIDYRFAGNWYRAEDSDTPVHHLTLAPGEAQSGSCGNGALSVFDRFSDRPDRGAIDEFVWKNIKVTK